MMAAGCQHSAQRDELPLQDAPAFRAQGDAQLPDRWWTVFDDGALNDRIDQALRNNFTLRAAWERLRQADAIARRSRSDRFPDLDAVAGVEGIERDNAGDDTEISLGLAASYEVDLWGRIDSAVEAARLRAFATEADYRTAALTLSGEVATTWYRLAVARMQVELTESQLDTNEKVQEVLERRFAVGQSGSADVLRQRQLVESTREQVIVARSRVQVLKHLLAVLEGRPPQSPQEYGNTVLPKIPPTPATGLPAELLQRRPDVMSAFYELRAADQDVAVAITDRYPRLNLTASLTTAAENPSGIFSDWVASIAADAVAPLFDGGERRAEVARAQAASRELLSTYGQTVLDAFREVEDALALEAEQVQRIDSLEKQLGLARETYKQLRTQYLNGAADFIDVLTALREQQQIERDLLSAQLERITSRISLYRSLAGGFETPRESGDDTTSIDDPSDGDETLG